MCWVYSKYLLGTTGFNYICTGPVRSGSNPIVKPEEDYLSLFGSKSISCHRAKYKSNKNILDLNLTFSVPLAGLVIDMERAD